MSNQSRIKKLVAAVLAVILGAGVVVVITDDTGPDGTHHRSVTISAPRVLTSTVDSADAGRAPDVALKAPAAQVKEAAPRLEKGLRAESPTPANLQAQEDAAARDDLPNVTPLAAPSQRGCLSRFVVNYSSRRGVAPRWIVLHETVSRNVVGWGDVNAIGSLFNRPAFAASSTYTLDREGHCLYLVRESDKPWTQAAANPWSVSFEIINSASRVFDRNLIGGAGRARLLGVMNDISKRWDIPLRRGRGENCVPTRAGVVDHAQLGPCAGGHADVGPFRNAIDPIIVDARRLCERRYRSAGHKVPARCRA